MKTEGWSYGDDILRKYFWGNVLPLITVLTLLVTTALAGEKTAVGQKSFLWKVKSLSATVYILGSVHVAKADIYPLAPVIEKSFAGSSVLALEADPAKAKDDDLLQTMMASASYPQGESLKGHLSAKTYSLAEKEVEKIGLPMESFERTRPWFLAMTIESLEFMRLGFDPANGIDVHFAAEAAGKKRIVELESFDYQIRMLNGFSDRDQELFLLFTLEDLTNLRESTDEMMRAWRSGDAKSMDVLLTRPINETPQLRPIMDKIYYRRNVEMSDKIGQFLLNRDTVFVVVGAAHLVGKEGIIEILRGKGYTVEQL